jgi:hypothetical protein
MFADVLTDQVGTWIFLVELQRRLTCLDQVVGVAHRGFIDVYAVIRRSGSRRM